MKPDANTDPYTQAELDRLFAACDDYHRTVFTFLLQTGLRYREASHLLWTNIDFARGVINVPGEQTVNREFFSRKNGKRDVAAVEFKSKSRKGRAVPIFAGVKAILLKWRAQHPDTVYVFGTRSDLPNGHWWEHGKELWRAAGLNCGVCKSCAGKCECERFFLHKFRHTFAHRCLDGGVPIHKVSKWMGHHSIEVTAIYLSGRSQAMDTDPFADAGTAHRNPASVVELRGAA
ncbi:MAG: site-specific integrase [Terracidiphilus sp.]